MNPPTSLRRSRRRGRGRDSGAVATELLLAVPALLLMVLAVVQFAVYAHARNIAQTVAAQAVAAARVDGGTAGAGRAAAQQLLAQLGPTLRRPVVDVQRGPARVTVTVAGSVDPLLPGLDLPITVRDDGPVEHLSPVTG